jgi:hypothetical protein
MKDVDLNIELNETSEIPLRKISNAKSFKSFTNKNNVDIINLLSEYD